MSRILCAMSTEFNKPIICNSNFLDPVQQQEMLDDPNTIFEQDFNVKKMDIVPIANPGSSSKIECIQ